MALVDPVAAAGAEVRGPPVAVAVLGVVGALGLSAVRKLPLCLFCPID